MGSPSEASLLSKMEGGYRERSESRMRVLSLGMKYIGTFYPPTPVHENPLSDISPILRDPSISPPPLPSVPPMPQTMEPAVGDHFRSPSPAMTMSDAGTPPIDECIPTPYRSDAPTEPPKAASGVAEVPQPLPPPPPHVAKMAEIHGAAVLPSDGYINQPDSSGLEASPHPFTPAVAPTSGVRSAASAAEQAPNIGAAYTREMSTGEPPAHSTNTPRPHPSPRHHVEKPSVQSFHPSDPPRIGRKFSRDTNVEPEPEFKLDPPRKLSANTPSISINESVEGRNLNNYYQPATPSYLDGPSVEHQEEDTHQFATPIMEQLQPATVATPPVSRAAAAAAAMRNEMSQQAKKATTQQVATQTPTTSATQTDLGNNDITNLLASGGINRSLITPPHSPTSATVETQTPQRVRSTSRKSRRNSQSENSEVSKRDLQQDLSSDDQSKHESDDEPAEVKSPQKQNKEVRKKRKAKPAMKDPKDEPIEEKKEEKKEEVKEEVKEEPKVEKKEEVVPPDSETESDHSSAYSGDETSGMLVDDLYAPLPSVESPCSSVSSADSSISFPKLPDNAQNASLHSNVLVKKDDKDDSSWVSAKVVSLHKGIPWVVTGDLPYATTYHNMKSEA
eukprot:TRINITY_DN8270_c0_g1_i1.p1 TRINITY_DN8270_c0_g1~~TRINITY_DN8270_c0_g1_i1.p1  ORF type:complete len:642 (+),score=158.55 TRINITY_DN8270_c0_g1_i1:73-1926(+)